MYLVSCLYFLILEKWPSVGDILWVPIANSPLVTRAICSRGSFYEDCVGISVVASWLHQWSGRFIWPWSGWLPGPALYRGCQLLVGGVWSWGSWLQNPGGPRASAVLVVGRVRIQENLGLLPTYWWMKPGPGACASLLVDRAMSWGLVAGPRGTRAGVRSLVGGLVPDTVGWGGWCLEACVGLLVGRDQAQPVPGQA